MKRKLLKRMGFVPLMACYTDGGAQPPTDPPAAEPVTLPTVPPVSVPPAEPPAKAYTDAEVEAAKVAAVEAYKQHLTEAQDFDKMTAEEKVVHLQNQMASEKLSTYTTEKLIAAELPPELLLYVKGKDEADTDERIQSFKSVYDKGVQAGVDKRFKANGYTPRGTGGTVPDKDTQRRVRGVSIK